MADNNEEKRIALLIDADNAPAAKIDLILAEVARYGVANVRRAYGNWKSVNLRSWEKLSTLMGDVQDAIAQMNACLRARKCNLVPYSTKGHFKPGKSGNVETSTGEGCCPGQTGHHLVPDTMVDSANCPGYKHGDAPTVCVESALKDAGSHGRIHDAMDAAMRDKLKAGKIVGGKIGMQETIDAAVKSHKKAFPLSGCSSACIRAQLKDYYDSLCPNASLDAKDKTGAAIGSGNQTR